MKYVLLYLVLSGASAVGLEARGVIDNLGWDLQSALLVLGITFPWRFLGYLISIPGEIDKEKDEKAESLRIRLTDSHAEAQRLRHLVEGGNLDITIEPVPLRDNKVASVRVHNNNQLSSVYCTAFLKRADWLYTPDTVLPRTENINKYNKPLSWDGGSEAAEIEIRPDQDGYVNIARFVGNQFVFTFFGPEISQSVGRYKIWVEIQCRGDKEHKVFIEKTFIGCIDTTATGDLVSGIDIKECDDVEDWKEEHRQTRSQYGFH